jgi:hypothetical protein
VAEETDNAIRVMQQIWNPERLQSVIFVKSSAPGSLAPKNFGTAFMISDDFALTAGHVVCADTPSHDHFSFVELHISEIARPPIIIENPEANVACYINGLDLALIHVPGLNEGHPHLDPGAFEDLKTDHFVTTFGFGGNLPGRSLKGNAESGLDDLLRVRTTIDAVKADSGAPVLDRTGRAVGVLVAGDESGTTVFVPLRRAQNILETLSIMIPAPATIEPIKPQGQSLSGAVSVVLGRKPDKTWPNPRTRPAEPGEAKVRLTIRGNSGIRTRFVETEKDGVWNLDPGEDIASSKAQFVLLATNTSDEDRPMDAQAFLSDPVRVEPQDVPVKLSLWERSAYVGQEVSTALSQTKTLQSDATWQDCSPLLQFPQQAAPLCKRADPDEFAVLQSWVAEIDASYKRAYDASSSDAANINLTTQIAANFANFRKASGRPCGAAETMQDLFDHFSNFSLQGELIFQTLDMVVACQQIGDSTPIGLMPWRKTFETRQAASIRLINETLDHFVQNPRSLAGQGKLIILDVTTALESYSNNIGPVALDDVARAIYADNTVFGFLKLFVGSYVTAWCGKTVGVPQHTTASIAHTLSALRQAAMTCPAKKSVQAISVSPADRG